MSIVTPFPRAKNRPFIERHAARMTAIAQPKAERYLRRLIDQHVDVMRRRGISEFVIADEARAVEAAIRAALWRAVLTPGGAA